MAQRRERTRYSPLIGRDIEPMAYTLARIFIPPFTLLFR